MPPGPPGQSGGANKPASTVPLPHLILPSAEHVTAAAAHLAAHLAAGDVLALVGPLGAGKTTFVQGLASGLGVATQVSSPTFALLQHYTGGRLDLFHADFYRMERSSESVELGLEEWIEGPAVLAVEWADRFARALPRPPLWIELQVAEVGGRSTEMLPFTGEGRVLRAWGESARTRALASRLLDWKP